jgi:hypothetical protein
MADFLRDGGIRTVRIPVTWYEHLDANGNVDEAWMDRVQQVVDYVVGDGMYCVLNVHHDTAAGDGAWVKADADNYAANHQRFENLWPQIATRFRYYDQHLLFEATTRCSRRPHTWSAPASTDSMRPEQLRPKLRERTRAPRAATTACAPHRQHLCRRHISPRHRRAPHLPTDGARANVAVQVHSNDPLELGINSGTDAACSTNLTDMMTRHSTRFESHGRARSSFGEYGTHGRHHVERLVHDSQNRTAADQAPTWCARPKSPWPSPPSTGTASSTALTETCAVDAATVVEP